MIHAHGRENARSCKGQTEWKLQSQKTDQTDQMDDNLVWFNGTMSHELQGHPRGHGGEFWQIWSTGEGNGKPLQSFYLENPMNNMKRHKNMTLKDELPRLVGAQYATREEWRNNSKKNEEAEPKQKQHPVVDVTGDGSEVQCCKEWYCIKTWNVRSMNHGKLEVIK